MVERLANETAAHAGLKLHAPGDIQGELTEWSVCPQEFGEFLVAIFDHWIKARRRQDFRNEYRMGVRQFCRRTGRGLPSSANLWALGDC